MQGCEMHFYKEGAYFLDEDVCFYDEDACFSGENMSPHREKLRLQTEDAHFHVAVSYLISTEKIYFSPQRLHCHK